MLSFRIHLKNCRVRIDRSKKNRPVWYIYGYNGKLPFQLDLGNDLIVQPKMVLKIYHRGKTNKEKFLAFRDEKVFS
jgi:hypothetical protein